MKSIRNIGIFAHVDAGKTTLSEQLLKISGAIRTAGSVDKGTAHTDRLPVERRRGISVKATCVELEWKDVRIHLIDTPGHVDFMSEIERSTWALDGAILVISAAEGVEPQTELLFHTFQRQNIPMILFLNKIDREGADIQRTMDEIREQLTDQAVSPEDTEQLMETVLGQDDELMERWLEGEEVPKDKIRQCFQRLCREGRTYPVLKGSALKGEGTEAVLDAIIGYLPEAVTKEDESCGIVFAVEQDPRLGLGAWVRMFSGSLENRQVLRGEHKISQIRDAGGHDTGRLQSGEIGMLFGIPDIRVGEPIGRADLLPRHIDLGSMGEPLMSVQAVPEDPEAREELRKACQILSLEDPLLQMKYVRQTGEIHLQVMGHIHQEVLQEVLESRFGLKAHFEKPTVIYKETIATPATGVAVYTMPKPCWAILHFLIEPGERGSGIRYRSEVGFREIPERYQHQVEQALPIALRQGRLGWEVTDVKITLVDGGYHHIHTHPLDFIVATPWGIQDGLEKGGSRLLEPVLDVTFYLPEEAVGRVMSDVAAMRGEVTDSHTEKNRTVLLARIPAATSMDYSEQLKILTGGRGDMTVRLSGYQDAPEGFMAARPRFSVDPLDTSKYILAARSALEGGIFDL